MSKRMPGRPSCRRPAWANWSPNWVLPIPVDPTTTASVPGRSPPPRSSSSPSTPVVNRVFRGPGLRPRSLVIGAWSSVIRTGAALTAMPCRSIESLSQYLLAGQPPGGFSGPPDLAYADWGVGCGCGGCRSSRSRGGKCPQLFSLTQLTPERRNRPDYFPKIRGRRLPKRPRARNRQNPGKTRAIGSIRPRSDVRAARLTGSSQSPFWQQFRASVGRVIDLLREPDKLGGHIQHVVVRELRATIYRWEA